MQLTTFQAPEIRGSNDQILQAGAYGKNTAFCNGQNTGILDYINNNLMALQNNKANSTALDNYLRTTGAVLTGVITSNTSNFVRRNVLDNYLALAGGSGVWDASGAGLILYGKNTTGNEGSFRLHASSDVGTVSLLGRTNGVLTWNGQEIERVSAIDKSANGYYKTASGLILQWGLVSITTAGTAQSVTFPTPFVSTNYKVVTTARSNGNYYTNATVGTNLAFNVRCSSAVAVWWIAIGY